MRLSGCLLLASLLLSACSVRSPNPEHWTLAATAPPPAEWDPSAPAVAIGPVELPRYLDHPQLLVRISPSQVEPAGLHRWADSLHESLGRVLASNLGRSLASARVSAYPVEAPYGVDFRVLVDVERFDGRPGDSLVLIARSVIMDGDRAEVLAVEHSRIEVEAGKDFASLVAAHSSAAGRLAEQIEARIRELGQQD